MNMDVSPCILKFKSFFRNTYSAMTAWIHVGLLQSKSEMIYPPKKVCLIIIHINTTHMLDMSCCHKHQQQRYHSENMCDNMNMGVSSYILKFKFFFRNTYSAMTPWIHVGLLWSKSTIIYLSRNVCFHKHQQQKYHNENTKISMFIRYMYANIPFPLTKAIPIMFEPVTTHYQPLQT